MQSVTAFSNQFESCNFKMRKWLTFLTFQTAIKEASLFASKFLIVQRSAWNGLRNVLIEFGSLVGNIPALTLAPLQDTLLYTPDTKVSAIICRIVSEVTYEI